MKKFIISFILFSLIITGVAIFVAFGGAVTILVCVALITGSILERLKRLAG